MIIGLRERARCLSTAGTTSCSSPRHGSGRTRRGGKLPLSSSCCDLKATGSREQRAVLYQMTSRSTLEYPNGSSIDECEWTPSLKKAECACGQRAAGHGLFRHHSLEFVVLISSYLYLYLFYIYIHTSSLYFLYLSFLYLYYPRAHRARGHAATGEEFGCLASVAMQSINFVLCLPGGSGSGPEKQRWFLRLCA